MVYLTRGGFWLTTGQIASSALGAVLLIAFANLLPISTYGMYRYVLSVIAILAIFALPGINVAFISETAQGNRGNFWFLFKTKVLWSLIGAGTLLVAAGYYLWQGNANLFGAFLVSGLAFSLFHASGLYDSILHGQKEFGRSVAYNTVIRFIAMAMMLTALFLTNNIIIILLIYFIPEIILNLAVTQKILKRWTGSSKPVVDRNIARYGFHLSIMDALKAVAGQIDKIIVFQFIGATELALYSFAMAAPNQVKNLLQNAKVLALPKLGSSPDSSIRNFLPRKILRFEIVAAITVGLYILAAPFIYKLFLPQYTEAILLSQIYALIILFLPRGLYSTALVAKAKKRELYHLRTISPVIKITILLPAVFWWGLWGAVVARVIGELATYFIYVLTFRRAFKVSTGKQEVVGVNNE